MNRLFRFTRFFLALMLAIGAAGFYASVALAAPTETGTGSWSGSVEVTDMCPFTLTVTLNTSWTYIKFFDNSGSLVKMEYHNTEYDTFTNAGKTLVGTPYHWYMKMLFDSSGNVASMYATGVMVKVQLPDGSWFQGAGRINYLERPPLEVYSWYPDLGHTGDIDAFCAALAP